MDEAQYREALGRIERFTLILSLVGIVGIWAAFTFRHALGFATGTILAYISFLFMKRMVNALGAGGEAPKARSARASAIAMGFRYLIIGGVIFAMMRVSGTGPWPVFAGLMTTVAAVLAELVYELATSSSTTHSL